MPLRIVAYLIMIVSGVLLCPVTNCSAAATEPRNANDAAKVALPWLAAQQESDGGWRFRASDALKPQPLDERRVWTSRTGATAVAMMPFLVCGQTRKQGHYKENVAAGLRFLISQGNHVAGNEQHREALDLRGSGDDLLWHAHAAMVLCEAFAMSADRELEKPSQAATDYLVAMQDPKTGGWARQVNGEPDLVVSAWCVLAIKSAHMAYLRVPQVAVNRVPGFLDRVQSENGAFYGRERAGKEWSATAAALLCRMSLGWKRDRDEIQQGIRYLMQTGPQKNDCEANYFAHDLLGYLHGENWQEWNRQIIAQLLASQENEAARQGTWFNAKDASAEGGGRLFQTALNAAILAKRFGMPRPVPGVFPL